MLRDNSENTLRRFGPMAAAVISALLVWYVWDAIVPIAKVHDESSYLLQAELFARGRWTAPSPPIPEFFEQPHVQVVPAVASKYPPGHALLLALGALLHFPPLVPLLLTGLSGALVFALATRVTNPWIGLATWTTWITAPIVLRFQPSYFSEVTTGAMLLVSWWSLLEWRDTRRTRWLLLLALAVGWGAITRPLTMLALAIPIGAVVLRDVVRLRLWRDLGLAFAVGVAVLAILPLWNVKTTGDWRRSAIGEYRKDYLPFDKPGFTADTSPPRRALNPVTRQLYETYLSARREQTLAQLPMIAGSRLVQLVDAFFRGPRLLLLLLALGFGISVKVAALRFGLVSAGALFLAYLPYAHHAPWTLYYLEITPVFALLAAAGVWWALERLGKTQSRMRIGALLTALVVVALSIPTIAHWKRDARTRSAFNRQFLAEIGKLTTPTIVFVRYSPRFASHIDVVYNHPDLDAVPVWVVHDLGARNDALRRLAPNRQSLDFDEEQLRGRD
jgi:4-amino-4-deoxy-L-arabinose transferase-like glycosyltransferase